ncbi:diguanylate cyclase domain-containing protein [Rhizosaccharibacter radicis]|uniref:GGDEF domain-containing protein n=1 Tax=Rhizosaccharibacter radicis TaxID=2782605 RepID=A0ABT1VVC7_9PROT|nr:GGDEF domain-containing protein [Acetobacteraceae bacterium KSS12]
MSELHLTIPSPPGVPELVADAERRRVTEALRSSRDRWRSLALLGADLVFETDHGGRLAFVAPDGALGWRTDALVGQEAATLLSADDLPALASNGRRRVRVRRGDGSGAVAWLGTERFPDGCRGALFLDEDAEARDLLVREALRGRMLRRIDTRMRRLGAPDTALRTALSELLDAIGADGALLATDRRGAAPGPDGMPGLQLLQLAGGALPLPEAALLGRLTADAGLDRPLPWRGEITLGDRAAMLVADSSRFRSPVMMLVWRAPTMPWLEEEFLLAAELLALLCARLDDDEVQREMASRSRTDLLTGLLNQDGFLFEIGRRLDRLDAEGLPATLVCAAVEGIDTLAASHGHEVADAALQQAATVLRDAVRPTDLIGRLGSDGFSLWLDGADQFAAAERAELICRHGVPLSRPDGHRLVLSVGIAPRLARSAISLDTLTEQAGAALGAVRAVGGGRWHVFQEGNP